MPFTGAHEHLIDAKNRLSIPASVRAAMHPERDGDQFVLVPGARRGTLSLYGNRRFERMAERRHSEDLPLEDEIRFDQMFFSSATVLEMDKQGRVLLPERVLKYVGIGREVVIAGVNDHLELWNKADYDAFLTECWANYAEYQQLITRRARPEAQTKL